MKQILIENTIFINPDPDIVYPERLDPDPVNIKPDPQPWMELVQLNPIIDIDIGFLALRTSKIKKIKTKNRSAATITAQ